jgi:hypothetical protein
VCVCVCVCVFTCAYVVRQFKMQADTLAVRISIL